MSISLWAVRITDYKLGIEREGIDSVTAVLVEDSALSAKENTYFAAELKRCSSDKTEATAHGRCTIITKSIHPLSFGDRVIASGKFIEDGVFWADSIATVPDRFSLIRRLHLAFVSDIERRMGYTPSARLSRLLLLGRSDAEDLPLKEAAKAAGCAHVLALSGMHLSILANTTEALTSPLFKRGSRKKKVLPTLVVLLFIFIAGPKPSLVRSAIMYILSTAAFFFSKKIPAPLLLFLSSLIQVALFPFQQTTTAFLLSYAALAGLITLQNLIQTSFMPFMPLSVASALSSSLSALVCSVPFSMYFFGSWTPVSIILSAPAAMLASFSMFTGMILTILGPNAVSLWLSNLSLKAMRSLFSIGEALEIVSGYRGYAVLIVIMLTVTLSLRYALSRYRFNLRRSFNVDI